MSDLPIYEQLCAELLIDTHLDLVRPRRVDVGALVTRAPTAEQPPDRPAAGRHHFRTDPFADPPTEPRGTAMTAPEQDDLTDYDPEVETTEKTSPADEQLQQPTQDPTWIPDIGWGDGDDVAPNAGSAS